MVNPRKLAIENPHDELILTALQSAPYANSTKENVCTYEGRLLLQIEGIPTPKSDRDAENYFIRCEQGRIMPLRLNAAFGYDRFDKTRSGGLKMMPSGDGNKGPMASLSSRYQRRGNQLMVKGGFFHQIDIDLSGFPTVFNRETLEREIFSIAEDTSYIIEEAQAWVTSQYTKDPVPRDILMYRRGNLESQVGQLIVANANRSLARETIEWFEGLR